MKKIFYILPKQIRQIILQVIELLAFLYIQYKVGIIKTINNKPSSKINILIYHISGLSFGGTEKNLQMIAKYLNKSKYNIFFMHGDKTEQNRLEYIQDSKVKIIHFNYSTVDKKWPYIISHMEPKLETIINQYKINCIITATPGQTIYPLINIKNIPILLINIFGSFSMQKNIVKHVCISNSVYDLANRVVPQNKLEIQYIPSERPLKNQDKAKQIRDRYTIKDTDLVYGRIGRSDDAIFDPIALLAFEIAIKTNPDIHYIIMSPAHAAKKIVAERNIPNVHWLEPSYIEDDVWAFHEAIDILAHFRADGESFGLNIAESMLAGNPILTHRSHIWNAHLAYLENTFSRYSEKDDYIGYAKNMLDFIEFHKSGKLKKMGKLAQNKAEKLFLIENIIERYESWINEAVQ